MKVSFCKFVPIKLNKEYSELIRVHLFVDFFLKFLKNICIKVLPGLKWLSNKCFLDLFLQILRAAILQNTCTKHLPCLKFLQKLQINFTIVSNQGSAKNVLKIEEAFQISLKNALKISFYSDIWLINEHQSHFYLKQSLFKFLLPAFGNPYLHLFLISQQCHLILS